MSNTDTGSQQAIGGRTCGDELLQNVPATDYQLAVTMTDPDNQPNTYSLQITEPAAGGSGGDLADTLDAGKELQDGQVPAIQRRRVHDAHR